MNLKRLRETVTLAALAFTFILSAQSDRVVGGADAVDGQFPWMVEVLFLDDEHLCGATLVHPLWVLTAGHCAATGDGADMRLMANSVNNTTAAPGPFAEELLIDTIHYHPDYDGEYGPDLAMIRLAAPATTPTVTLLDPALGVLLQNGDSALALGWGTADTLTLFGSDVLQNAPVALVDHTTCAALYASSTTDLFGYNGTAGLICAAGFPGEPPTGSGNGDSGGPLMITHNGGLVQIGVVYGGELQYATAAYPGVYTTIATNWDWIQSLINGASHVPGAPAVEPVTFTATEASLVIGMRGDLGNGAVVELFSSDGKRLSVTPAQGSISALPWPVSNGLLVARVLDRDGLPIAARTVVRPF